MKKILFLAAALVAVAGLELVVRLSGYSAPFWYRPDPDLGWALRHEPKYALDKPDDAFRIAVLGDEYSEERRREPRDAWWRQLGRDLEGCSLAGGKRVEVLTFGVSSYGTAQELVMLETRAMRYQPDLVLLQFTPLNDPQNNSFALAADKERPFYRLEGGRLRIDDSFNGTAKFARHAAPSHEIARRIGDRSRAVQWLSMLPEGRHGTGVQKALLGPPPNELWEEAWRVTEALVLRIADYSRRNGAKFALVSVSGGYGGERIGALAAKHRLQFVPLDLNGEGQRAAAERIAASLCGSRDTRLRSE